MSEVNYLMLTYDVWFINGDKTAIRCHGIERNQEYIDFMVYYKKAEDELPITHSQVVAVVNRDNLLMIRQQE